MSQLMLRNIFKTLESGDDLRPEMRKFLRDSLNRWDSGLTLERALRVDRLGGISERDRIIREHAAEVPGSTDYAKAKKLSEEARKLDRGCGTRFQWLLDAREHWRLPDTKRQFQNIISGK